MAQINAKLEFEVETPLTLDGLAAALEHAKTGNAVGRASAVYMLLAMAVHEARLYRAQISDGRPARLVSDIRRPSDAGAPGPGTKLADEIEEMVRSIDGSRGGLGINGALVARLGRLCYDTAAEISSALRAAPAKP